jgi:type I restriction-modification system DNA methylase subunit
MSERSKTDVITRKKLEEAGFYKDSDWNIYEEETEDSIIQELLKHASKQGNNGRGKPEFIGVHKKSHTVLIVEDKLDPKKHISKDLDHPADFAVDGVLHYASKLIDHFDIIAVGCSGGDESEFTVSSYLWRKGESKPGLVADKFLSSQDYLSVINRDVEIINQVRGNLRGFSRQYHNDLRDYAKLLEEQKPVFVGAILTALTDPAFRKTYREYKGRPVELADMTVNHIRQVLNIWIDDEQKRQYILHSVGFIKVHPTFANVKSNVLMDLIDSLERNVHPEVDKDVTHLDMLTEFYREFVRYSGGDGKGLGIVMTPPHICDLFAEMANLHENSRVLDCCMGTGGFLVASLSNLKMKFGNDEAGLAEFQRNNLIGVEQQANMFTLSCINMMLRKCNPDNFYLGSCFNLTEDVKSHRCNVGFLNPPYSQKGQNLKEFDFVEHMMNCLTEGSLGFAILPMSCAVGGSVEKSRLLKNHTLVAAMSMPDDLFYPTGVVPCILVFKAHIPHNSKIETWFGYWKDDGHIKIKKEGRVDYYNQWAQIKCQWVDMFLNQKELPGIGVKHKVSSEDEWCAEAYVETDYNKISANDFRANTLSYLSHRVLRGDLGVVKGIDAGKSNIILDSNKWSPFSLAELFQLKKGRRIVKKDSILGSTAFVSATDANNGISNYLDIEPDYQGNAITVNYDGSVGEAFYQIDPFFALDSVNVLIPKFDLNVYRAMFLITIIKMERFKFSYGRKWHLGRMRQSKIKLPVTIEGDPDWGLMENYIKSII